MGHLFLGKLLEDTFCFLELFIVLPLELKQREHSRPYQEQRFSYCSPERSWAAIIIASNPAFL
jgi:hypothetical protein